MTGYCHEKNWSKLPICRPRSKSWENCWGSWVPPRATCRSCWVTTSKCCLPSWSSMSKTRRQRQQSLLLSPRSEGQVLGTFTSRHIGVPCARTLGTQGLSVSQVKWDILSHREVVWTENLEFSLGITSAGRKDYWCAETRCQWNFYSSLKTQDCWKWNQWTLHRTLLVRIQQRGNPWPFCTPEKCRQTNSALFGADVSCSPVPSVDQKTDSASAFCEEQELFWHHIQVCVCDLRMSFKWRSIHKCATENSQNFVLTKRVSNKNTELTWSDDEEVERKEYESLGEWLGREWHFLRVETNKVTGVRQHASVANFPRTLLAVIWSRFVDWWVKDATGLDVICLPLKGKKSQRYKSSMYLLIMSFSQVPSLYDFSHLRSSSMLSLYFLQSFLSSSLPSEHSGVPGNTRYRRRCQAAGELVFWSENWVVSEIVDTTLDKKFRMMSICTTQWFLPLHRNLDKMHSLFLHVKRLCGHWKSSVVIGDWVGFVA